MSKRKAIQKNPLRYWVDEIIFFKREFVYFTPAPVDRVAAHLRKLSYEKPGCGRTRRIIATVEDGVGESTFEIKAEQPSESNYYQSAQATGVIFRDDDDLTVIQGNIKMGAWSTWLGFLIPIIFLSFVMTNVNEDEYVVIWTFLIIFGGFMILNWVQLYNDRNHLYQIIQRTIEMSQVIHEYQP